MSYATYHSVYELIDPRDGLCFYIGYTCQETGRYYAHRSDPASASYHRIREIEAAGLKCELRAIAYFPTKDEALDYESYLISTTPGLVNRTGAYHKGCYWLPKPTRRVPRPVVGVKPELTYVPIEELEGA